MDKWLGLLDRFIAAVLRSLQWLILPVVILLFLQWPLRDLVRSHSREANDLGQWIFAALRPATRPPSPPSPPPFRGSQLLSASVFAPSPPPRPPPPPRACPPIPPPT